MEGAKQQKFVSSAAKGDGENPGESASTKNLMGQFANVFEVGHTAAEFLFDFGQFYPENGEERFFIRVVTCPRYAKAFLKIFQNALYGYEDQYGVIEEDDDKTIND